MEEIITSAKVDFANLLSLALNESLPWKYISLILDNMNLNQEQSKNIIKVLVKELQQLHAKLQGKEEDFENTFLKSNPQESYHETVESDTASENDIQSVKDISEDEVSLIDPKNMQIDNELLNNREQIAVESYSEEESIVIENEYYTFVGDNSDKRSDSEEIPSIESEKPISRIPIESTTKCKIQKKHKCNICKKDFHTKKDLVRHERIHSGEKPYQCKSCSKAFATNGNLKNHEKIHLEEKPFTCQSCPKSFSVKQNLKRHETTHTGIRPFQCKTCPKSFTLKRNLKVHEKFHTGEKPFQCQNCPKRFTLKGDLNKHNKKHH